MKNWSFKSFGAGVLASALVVGMSFPVSAALKQAELYYKDIQLRINGELVEPKDANGNKVEPFIMDGTTYLPIRAVGEALGLSVDWDGATNTVILGNDADHEQPAAWLNDLTVFSGSVDVTTIKDNQHTDYSTANNGDTFERYMCGIDGAEYLLKGQYTSFTGTWYLTENMKNSPRPYVLTVYLDEQPVYTAEVGKGMEPVSFTVDTTDAYKMKLLVQQKQEDGSLVNFKSFFVCLGNAALWNN